MLCDLAQLDSTYSSEALSAAELIHDESDRARVLIKLATNDAVNFAQLLAVTGSFQDEISRARVLIALAENEAVDSPKLLAAVESIELIQYEYSRPGMWFHLAKINSAFRAHLLSFLQSIQNKSSQVEKLLITNTPEWAAVLVTLAKIDSSYFSEALSVARSIQDKSSRTKLLIELAKIDSSYFSEALSALRMIQETSEPDLLAQNPLMASFCSDVWSLYEQILALMNLAQIDSTYFLEILLLIQLMEDESDQVKILTELAQQLPESFLPQTYTIIYSIAHKPSCAELLSIYLPRLPLAILSLSNWQSHLHPLAHRTRADLMQDLATLYPVIVHLGGKEAVRGMIDAMRDVCNQWK
ncbi:hypothetical protein [Leptolyngbya sp. UWPOB_LEPTO1]|uniref:hypothetical protein n=1 Tax=Leptolyngbya sp. UWPOB_LEPTO1 TaxID=2815653 RepID=UPI002579626A|nr:hypothetical protein [Leptolyngbya sp. UWPOB_LEPTO1]